MNDIISAYHVKVNHIIKVNFDSLTRDLERAHDDLTRYIANQPNITPAKVLKYINEYDSDDQHYSK